MKTIKCWVGFAHPLPFHIPILFLRSLHFPMMSKVIPLDEERHCAKYLVMDDLSERDIRADDGRVRRISLLLLRMEVQFVVLLSLLFCSVCWFAQFVVLL